MAHQLETNEKGEARMFYAGKAPWHKLGISVEKEITSAAAIRLAGLDWTVEKQPLFAQVTTGKKKGKVIDYREVESHFALVRTEDQQRLGVVGKSYQPIQNSEAFGFLDSLVGEGLAMFHTAGSLFNGRKVFISCKMPKSVKVGPDKIDKYLVLVTAHDGTMAMHVKWTPIRVVCWNTASAAFNIHGGKVKCQDNVTVWHTRKGKQGLEEARRLLGLTDAYYERLDECFNKLIKTPMNNSEFGKFSHNLYPDGENDKGKKIDRSKKRNTLKWLFHEGVGNKHKDVKGTRWAAYNSVTEYIDHEKKYLELKTWDWSVSDTRMNSIVWGSGADTKRQALALLAN